VEARGEIFSVPADRGITRNLTNSSGARDRRPAWSPDGKHIAYMSDADEEVQLYLADPMGREQPLRLTDEPGIKYWPLWSPDGKTILYGTADRKLQLVEVEKKKVRTLAESKYYTWEGWQASWSPDSRYVAYMITRDNEMGRVAIEEVESGKVYPVSPEDASARFPTWSKSGDYLYYLQSRPEQMSHIMSVSLAPEDKDPYAKEDDEETGSDEASDDDKKNGKDKSDQEGGGKADEVAVEIKFDGIENRIRRLPEIEPKHYDELLATKGHLYFLDWGDKEHFWHKKGGPDLRAYNLDSHEIVSVADGVERYWVGPAIGAIRMATERT